MPLADLNSNPHGGKSLRNIIDHATGSQFYPTSGSEHCKLLCLNRFHGTHINDQQSNNDEMKITWCVKCEISGPHKYPMYKNLPRTPASIKRKNTVHSSNRLFIWTCITSCCKSPASFHKNDNTSYKPPPAFHWNKDRALFKYFIYTDMNNQWITNNTRFFLKMETRHTKI